MLSRCASRRFILRCHQTAILRPKRRWKHEAGLLPSMPNPPEKHEAGLLPSMPDPPKKHEAGLLPSMPNPPKEESISVSLLPQVQKGTLVLKTAVIPSQQSVGKGAPSHKPVHKIPLAQWYRRNHPKKDALFSSAFEASIIEEAIPGKKRTKKWHTVTFTCPVTGHVIDAGTIRTTNMGEIKVIDGKVYYERSTWAKRAACYRMMDSIQYTKSQHAEPRDCEEDPITLPSKLFQNTPNDSSPVSALNNEYQCVGIKNVANLAITVNETGKGWIASFTCPITGYSVGAGVMRGWKDLHAIEDGIVHYKEAIDAKRAAAAQFLDNLRYTETKEIEPRWCEEVPSLIEKNGIEKLFSDLSVENKLSRKMRQEEHQADTMMHAIFSETKMRRSDVTSYEWLNSKTPTAVLNLKYQKSRIQVDSKSIEVIEADKGWTASFTCPVTGYIAKAGTLRGAQDFYVIDDGVVYYMEAADAQHAVAARFLDNLRFTETRESEPRWCEEVPSLIEKTGIETLFSVFPIGNKGLESVPKPAILSEEQQIFSLPTMLHALYIESNIPSDGKKREKSDAANFYSWVSNSTPKAVLNLKYQASRILGALKSTGVTKTNKGWTASFTCPVTGYTAEAGALRGTKDFHIKEEGVVYYKGSRADAEHAAAARFLDNLQYTETKEIEPRWCEEVPCLIENKGIEKLFSDQKLQKQKGTVIATKVTAESAAAGEETIGDQLVFSYRPSSTLQVDDVEDQVAYSENLVIAYPPSFSLNGEKQEASQSPSEAPTLNSHESHFLQEPENEEELTIHNISAFKPVGTSTLERVMEALGETATTYNNPSEGTNASSRGPIQTTPAQQKKKVIDDTIAWYKRLTQQEKPEERGYAVFQTAALPMTVRSATTALRVLAKAHWRYPSEDPETDQRVEYAAKQMLDLMWTAGFPSADEYNSYLLCLARSSAAFEAAQAAERILRAMLEQKELDGRLLPKPNVETFNAVIQLWAVAGGSTGFSKCEEIFNLMEEGRGKGLELQPTRDTFLSILSSLARPSSVDNVSSFDRERAQQWIEQMRRQGEDNNDDTLTLDTQVFNAPLRWSGGIESTRSRPFTQGLLWDTYPDIFKEGFRPLKEEDPLWIEARRIEEWLLEMETIGPAPDVETFEAAIQAWTRTGMADGLRRAELVALRAVASDKIRPRLQSFHPLFAAWAFSGGERGPEKIQDWITRLEEKSRTFPETKPDTRVQTSLYIARRNQQKRLLARKDEMGVGSEDQNVDAITKATQIAKSCSEDLDQLVGQIRRKRNDPKDNVDGFLNPAIFSHTLCAWGDVAVAKVKYSQSDGDPLDRMAAETQEILGVVKQYDEAIQHLRSKQAAQHENSKEHPQFDVQLGQFLRHSQTVYLNTLSYLNELDRQLKNQEIEMQTESSKFYQHFFEVESMLRRAEELRMALHASTQFSSVTTAPEDVTLVYDDLFTYPSDILDAGSRKSYREKQIALYSEIVDGCKRMEGSDCFGDSVRLCMLILDLLEHAPPTGQAADCTDVYLGIISVVENIPNEDERYQVLRRVFHSVNSSPFTIDKDSVMAVINQKEEPAVKGRKKPTRSRRPVKRQRWRTASHS